MIIFEENLASMKHPLLPLLFAVALTVLPLRSQDKVTRSVLELGRTDNRTVDHADYIARNIGGRIVGSHMLNHAEDWVASASRYAKSLASPSPWTASPCSSCCKKLVTA